MPANDTMGVSRLPVAIKPTFNDPKYRQLAANEVARLLKENQRLQMAAGRLLAEFAFPVGAVSGYRQPRSTRSPGDP